MARALFVEGSNFTRYQPIEAVLGDKVSSLNWKPA
jgi:hypothetical protein